MDFGFGLKIKHLEENINDIFTFHFDDLLYPVWLKLYGEREVFEFPNAPSWSKLTYDLPGLPNQENLRINSFIPSSRPQTLSIWIYDNVPEEFIGLVLFHELNESKLRIEQCMDQELAHLNTTLKEDALAKKYLTLDKRLEYMQLRKNYYPNNNHDLKAP